MTSDFQNYMWNPVIPIAIFGVFVHHSLEWIALLVLALLCIPAVRVTAHFSASNSHIKMFFREYLDPKRGKYQWPPATGCSFKRLDVELLFDRTQFESYMIGFADPDFSALLSNVDEYLKSHDPAIVWYPCVVLEVTFPSGSSYPRAATYNAMDRMLITVNRGFNLLDPYQLFLLFHEIEHATDRGEKQLSLINSWLILNTMTISVLVAVAASWWHWVVILLYLLSLRTTRMRLKIFREFNADIGAIAMLLKNKVDIPTTVEVLGELKATWRRQLKSGLLANYKRYERATRIHVLESCERDIRRKGSVSRYPASSLPIGSSEVTFFVIGFSAIIITSPGLSSFAPIGCYAVVFFICIIARLCRNLCASPRQELEKVFLKLGVT